MTAPMASRRAEPRDRLPEESSVPSGEMTLLEHLLELRTRLMWAGGAVVLGMLVFFVPSVGFGFVKWLQEPAKQANPDFKPQFIDPLENLATYFRVALLGGITVGMPMIVYQAVRFVGPALTPGERRWLYPLVLGASAAFVGGMAFAYYLILPVTLDFLLNFGSEIAEPDFRIGNYINFVTRMMLVMGLVFETPIVVMGLAKLGVVHWRKLIRWWRYAIIGAFLASAVLTPTVDPVTQSMVAGPIIVLYAVGIVLAWIVRPVARPRD